jgi:hypothetical protein
LLRRKQQKNCHKKWRANYRPPNSGITTIEINGLYSKQPVIRPALPKHSAIGTSVAIYRRDQQFEYVWLPALPGLHAAQLPRFRA